MYRRALLALACLALAVAPALAAAPLWTHTATEPVQDCAVSSDGKVIVVSSDLLHVFDRKGSLLGTTWRAADVALGPKAALIALAGDDGVRVVLANGTVLWTAPNRSVAVAVSGDGKTVAGTTQGGLLTVFGPDGVRVGAADTGATGDAVDLAVSENGSVIVSTDAGGVRAFTRKGTGRWSADHATPSALALSANGDLVAVGDGGSVKLYNLTGERLARIATAGRVRSLAMTPSANLTVAGVDDGAVLALGPQGEPLWNLSAGARVNRVAVSASGAVVAAAAADRRLLLVNGNGTRLWDAPLAGDPVALALSADGTTVAVGCGEGTAVVFDTGLGSAAAATTAKASNATAAKNGTAGANTTPASNATPSAASGAANGTPAAGRTPAVTATAASNTTPLQLVVPAGTAKSGVPLAVPVAALALLGAWAGLRRRG